MKNVTVQHIKHRLDHGETVNLLDVREPDERSAFNIGGKFLPLRHILATQTDSIADWQQEEVIVYCRSGYRSTQAALILESLGFINVINLEGGILAWQALYQLY
jgi:rhodanese-related sulfurtransferase